MTCRVLMVYPNAEGYSRVPVGLSVLSSVLKEAGHEVRLFDTTFIKSKNIDNKYREKINLVKTVEIDHLYKTQDDKQINFELINILKEYNPQLILFSIVEENLPYAVQLMRIIKENFGGLIVAGGVTPTAVPEEIMKIPYINIVCVGEGEEAMLDLCSAIARDGSYSYIKNLWIKQPNGAIIRNPSRPFIDLNILPFQDIELFDDRHIFKPFDGRLERTVGLEMSRGCPLKCSFCANETMQWQLKECGVYHREKSIEKSIEEMRYLKDKFKLTMIFFNDENFLMMSNKRFEDFCRLYKQEVNLPFYIQTRPETTTKEKVKKLKEINCATVAMGVESGSEKLRKTILKRYMSNQQIIDAFKYVHAENIRTTSNNMIGFPLETKEDILETIKLNKKIQPKSLELSYMAPYYGTRLHSVCVLLNLIPEGMVKDITLRKGTVLNFPKKHKEFLNNVFLNFSKYVYGELELPKI